MRQVVAERRRAFDGYLENIVIDYILGLQTPLPKLFTTPGFTEAYARAALEVAERKVRSLQRFIKRVVEREIFAPSSAGPASTRKPPNTASTGGGRPSGR